MCQSLLPKGDGKGRAMCMEIMVPNAAIRNLIREDKIHQIYSAMQSGQEKFGMQTFNQSLATAVLPEADHAGNGAHAFQQPGRIAGNDQPGRGPDGQATERRGSRKLLTPTKR